MRVAVLHYRLGHLTGDIRGNHAALSEAEYHYVTGCVAALGKQAVLKDFLDEPWRNLLEAAIWVDSPYRVVKDDIVAPVK